MMFMPLLFGFFCYNFAAALALVLHDAGPVDDPPALPHAQPARTRRPSTRAANGRAQARARRFRGQTERPGLRRSEGRISRGSSTHEPRPPSELLDTTLGHLGYAFDIQEDVAADGTITLQVYTGEAERLIGPGGRDAR